MYIYIYIYIHICVYIYIYIGLFIYIFIYLARDVGGVNVNGVKGVPFDIKCTSCAKLCITCAFMLQNMVPYILLLLR